MDSAGVPLLDYLTPDPSILGTLLKSDAHLHRPTDDLHLDDNGADDNHPSRFDDHRCGHLHLDIARRKNAHLHGAPFGNGDAQASAVHSMLAFGANMTGPTAGKTGSAYTFTANVTLDG